MIPHNCVDSGTLLIRRNFHQTREISKKKFSIIIIQDLRQMVKNIWNYVKVTGSSP